MKTKNPATFCFLLGIILLGLPVHAQNSSNKVANSRIGVYCTPYGTSDVFQSQDLDGTGSYKGGGVLGIGVNYIRSLNKIFSFETGVEYARHRSTFTPPYMGESFDLTSTERTVNLFSIPCLVKVTFAKYFFINGGFVLDFDVSKNHYVDDQTGLGGVFGLGLQYEFKSGLSVYVNPCCKVHSLVPFSNDKYHERIWEDGVRVGVTYRLGR